MNDRGSPRYVPVRYHDGHRLLMKAAIEDRRDKIVIPVVNASVAVTLADLLNREERQVQLPPAAPAQVPAPFSVVNPDAGAGPPFFVLWSSSVARRFMAITRSRAEAERLARLLNHVAYPVHTSPWRIVWQLSWAAVLSDWKDAARLEEPTLPPTQLRRANDASGC